MQLHAFSLRLWDESRLAWNALEMYRDHRWWVLYFEGQPDMWNTKPPLLTWLHVAIFELFGIRDWVLRLPSAFAGLCTVLLILYFTVRKFSAPLWGMLSGLVLVTSMGYVRMHGTRTCEYDALLAFFTTLYILSFWMIRDAPRGRYWVLFTAALVLAGLTKGIAAYIFLPSLLFGVLLAGNRLKNILQLRFVLISAAVTILVVMGCYLIRESQNPGFLRAVYENELGGRYLSTVEGHRHPFEYYLGNLAGRYYGYWFPFWLTATIAGCFYTSERERGFHMYLSVNTLFYWLIISLSSTKLEWYDLPMYPLMAMVTGLFLKNILAFIPRRIVLEKFSRYQLMPILAVILLCVRPYREMILQINADCRHDMDRYEDCLPHFLKAAARQDGTYFARQAVVVDYGYVPNVAFYVEQLRGQGNDIRFKRNEQICPGDTVITRMDITKAYIEDRFKFTVVSEQAWVRVYAIQSEKI